jgi:hypothetical protein
MEVGDQRHAPAALTPGKTRHPIFRRLDGRHSRSGRVRKISAPSGFDPRTFQPVASQVLITNAEVLAEQQCRVCTVTQQACTHRAMFSVTVWVLHGRGTAGNISLATSPHTTHCVSTDMHPYLYQRKSDPVHGCMWFAQQILPVQCTCSCIHLRVVPVYAACVAKNSPRYEFDHLS